MPPRGVKRARRVRQYEHIKESARERGAGEDRAEEIAARTVNKQRRQAGETKGTRKRTAKRTAKRTKKTSTRKVAKKTTKRASKKARKSAKTASKKTATKSSRAGTATRTPRLVASRKR